MPSLRHFICVLLITLASAAPLWAQEVPEGEGEPGWLLGYFIAFLGIALGLVVLLRPPATARKLLEEERNVD